MKYLIPGSVGLLYIIQGVYHLTKKEYGFAIMWLAYGIANLGLILAMAAGQESNQ